MKVFRFNLHTVAYIAAENSREAYTVAIREAGRIMGDDPNPSIELDEEITHVSELEQTNDGWDDNCIPYGAVAVTIAQILGG
jgi:hypothetical protein